MNKLTLKKVIITNFRSYRGTHEINFTPGPIFILGQNNDPGYSSNAAGKSTVPHAIAYALFGELSTEAKKDEVINYDEDAMAVELYLDGLIIKRTKSRGMSETLAYWGEEAHVEEDLKPTQERLNAVLGITKELFFNALWLDAASKTVQFLFKKPAERLAILVDLIGGEDFQAARKKAYGEQTELTASLQSLEEKITDATTQTSDSQNRLKNLQEAQAADTTRAQEAEAERLRNIALQEDNLDSEELLRDVLLQSERQLREKDIESLADIDKNLYVLEGNLALSRRTLVQLQGDAKVDGTCPTCLRPFTKEETEQAQAAFQKCSQEIQKLVSRLQTERGRRKTVVAYWDALAEAQGKIRDRATRIERITLLIEHLKSTTVEATSDKFQPLILREQQTLQTIQDRIDDLKAQVRQTTIKLPKVKFWVHALGAHGIQNLLLDDIRSLIDQFTTGYLQAIGGDILGLEMPKSDKGFEIKMKYRGRYVGVQNLSRGEVGRNEMAFILGMRRALLYLNRCRLDFVVLDDALGDMDEAGQRLAIDMAEVLAEEIGSILVTLPMNHEDIPPHQILRVEKKDGRSQLA